MQIAPLTRIDCVLLHEAVKGLPESELRSCVMAVLVAAGLIPVEEGTGEGTGNGGTGSTLVFRAGDWRLRVHHVPAPMAREALKHVLSLPYTRTVFSEAGEKVQAHVAHTWLSLEKVPDGSQNGGTPFTDSREALPAMSLVALLAREIMSHKPASAVYWAPSDHLLPPALFETFTTDTRLILLNIRPQYFAGGEASDRDETVGMVAWGTQHLIGRLVVVEPSALPPGELHGLAAAAVMSILDRGRLPEEGERITGTGMAWHAAVRSAAERHVPEVESLLLRPLPAAADTEQRRKDAGSADFRHEGEAAASESARAGSWHPSSMVEPEDPDLSSLPPELRDEILYQRRRHRLEDDGASMGSLRNMAMSMAMGVVAVVIAIGVFGSYFRSMSVTESPSATARPGIERRGEIMMPDMPNPMPPAAVEGKGEPLDRDERRVQREDVVPDENLRDDEEEDVVQDEEKEVKRTAEAPPKDEAPPRPREDDDEPDPDMDDGREIQDMVTD